MGRIYLSKELRIVEMPEKVDVEAFCMKCQTDHTCQVLVGESTKLSNKRIRRYCDRCRIEIDTKGASYSESYRSSHYNDRRPAASAVRF